jgi:MscS family membrane protein
VGDFCRLADGRSGTVEEIGLRSTRIRTVERTLLTIPNADFAQHALENFAHRDRMLLQTTIALRCETTAEQLVSLLADMRRMLAEHPRIGREPAHVRLVGLGPSALNVEVSAYVETGDAQQFLEIREQVYLRLLRIVSDNGSALALPSQTVYLGRDRGLGGAGRSWRERREVL